MKLSELHIRRHDDGSYAAIWGPFLLKTGFQPIFEMGAGPTRIGAFEALCRPFRDGVATTPEKFFPLVPQSDAYRVELQTRAVHVLNAPAVLTDSEGLYLNFDPSMFADRSSVETALNILDETLAIANMDRKRVVCEVTEHKTSEDNLLQLVGQLRSRGFRIAIDDYGSHESDMARVRKLSPDIVKFDAQWIANLMDSGAAGADLLKDMVQMFSDRGITTLFEGIEFGWQLDLAVECGVAFVQGFVLARPQTVPSDFHDFRARQNMKVPPKRQIWASDEPVRKKLSGFNAWDNEIASIMDGRDMGMSGLEITRMDPIRVDGSKSALAAFINDPQARYALDPLSAPSQAAPASAKLGSLGTAFGTRTGSFGQKR